MSSATTGLVSLDRAAELLGVSRRQVSRWTSIYRRTRGRDGIGPVYQIGRRITRVPLASVRDYLERFRRPGDAKAKVSPI
jgi:hypothetical protein